MSTRSATHGRSLAEVINRAADAGEITHLTRHGKRVAAVVPDELLMAVTDATSAAWRRLVRARLEASRAEAAFWEEAATAAASGTAPADPVGLDETSPGANGYVNAYNSSLLNNGMIPSAAVGSAVPGGIGVIVCKPRSRGGCEAESLEK